MTFNICLSLKFVIVFQEKDETDSGYRSGTIPDDNLPKASVRDTLSRTELQRKVETFNYFVPKAALEVVSCFYFLIDPLSPLNPCLTLFHLYIVLIMAYFSISIIFSLTIFFTYIYMVLMFNVVVVFEKRFLLDFDVW